MIGGREGTTKRDIRMLENCRGKFFEVGKVYTQLLLRSDENVVQMVHKNLHPSQILI
jgi:hypothetical protein